jgi:gentisate 1,2-dioxygenase
MNEVPNLKTMRAEGFGTLESLYGEAERLHLTPGWIKREKPVLTHEPTGSFVAAQWRYQEDVKPALDAACRLVDVHLAERRNLIMCNPGMGANVATAETLVCAYQTILPGEAARSHRHSPHALRVIIDAKGAFSVVDGEQTPMETGDVVLTPGWCWHGHGHHGDEPAYWFDGLDVPLVQILGPMFFEEHPQGHEPVQKVVQESPFRFSRASIARALDQANAETEGFHGPRIKLNAPDMPTIELHMERLPAGLKTRRQRSTANRVFCVTEGSGETTTDQAQFRWQRGDSIVVPAWSRYQHRAESDAVLFEMSDEPLMRFAKYHRFEAD